MQEEYQHRVVMSPTVMVGKPVIRGTRVPVELIVRLVAQGVPFDDILLDYPRLELADIQAALWYATALVGREEVFPLQVERA